MEQNKLPSSTTLQFEESIFEFHPMESGYLYIRIKEHQLSPRPTELTGFQDRLLELVATHPIIIADIRAAKAPNKGLINWSIQLQKEAAPMVQGVGFIIQSPISKFIANLFSGILRSSFKTKTFTKIEQAADWAISNTPKSQRLH